uniref:antizyme inhibitor 2-like isoform X1 n=1 Tax=Styela clava TaxID=7725 RepID=UPI00193947AC|nr:antizyme inhibitor 2-like isoform X1 [Styela clava]
MMSMDSKIVYSIQTYNGTDHDNVCRYIAKHDDGRQNPDDSFYVFDLGELTKLYTLYNSLLPRVKTFYAVKSAAYDPLLSALMELGSGFYCASQEELNQVKRLGVRPEKIMLSNPCKQISHLRTAKEHGVSLLVFDNEYELRKLKEYYPTSRLLLRISVEESEKKKMYSTKYGAAISDARELILMAKGLDLNVVGVYFHVGLCTIDESVHYQQAFSDAKELFDFSEKNGVSLKLLNIGGGLRSTNSNLRQTVSSINLALEKLFPTSKYPDLDIISEPGGFFSKTSFTLATNVIGKREFKGSDTQYHYYLNEGTYGAFLSTFTLPKELKYFIKSESIEKRSATNSKLWGPVMNCADKVTDKIILPELDIGDWIFWRNMGEYSFACSTRFCGFGTKSFYNVISNNDLFLFQQLQKKKSSCFIFEKWTSYEES